MLRLVCLDAPAFVLVTLPSAELAGAETWKIVDKVSRSYTSKLESPRTFSRPATSKLASDLLKERQLQALDVRTGRCIAVGLGTAMPWEGCSPPILTRSILPVVVPMAKTSPNLALGDQSKHLRHHRASKPGFRLHKMSRTFMNWRSPIEFE